MCNFRSIRSAVENSFLPLVFGAESSVSSDKYKHSNIDATACQ